MNFLFIKKTIVLFILSLFIGCTPLNTNDNSEQLEFPNADIIKSDLLTRELDHWRFDNLNEFETFTIKNQALSEDNKSVSISCETELIDLSSSEKQRGELIVKYNLKENNIWEFVSVTGIIDDIVNTYDDGNDQNKEGDLDVPHSRIAPDDETNNDDDNNYSGDKPIEDAIVNKSWINNDDQVMSNNYEKQQQMNLVHNWQCFFCRIIIQKEGRPLNAVCKVSESEQNCGGCTHNWKDLGATGINTYQCYYCHEIIKSNDKPLNAVCKVSESEQNCGGCTHNWKKL